MCVVVGLPARLDGFLGADRPTGAEICRSRKGAEGAEKAMEVFVSSVKPSNKGGHREYIHGQRVWRRAPYQQPPHWARIVSGKPKYHTVEATVGSSWRC